MSDLSGDRKHAFHALGYVDLSAAAVGGEV